MCVNENTHLKWLGIRCMLCFFLFVHDKHWDCTTLLTLLSDAMGLQINLLHTCVIAADFFFFTCFTCYLDPVCQWCHFHQDKHSVNTIVCNFFAFSVEV